VYLLKEEKLEDTKKVIRSCKSKLIKYNDQAIKKTQKNHENLATHHA
jgi:hypothetical protein